MPSRIAVPSLVVLALAQGCGGATPPPSAHPRGPSAQAPSYTLHEWGVVRAEAGDVLRLSATAPAARASYFFDPGAVVEKPVLYFHLDAPGEIVLRSLRVTVDAHVVEHWPYVESAPQPRSITWSGWSLRSEHCASSGYAEASSPVCAGLPPGDACESSSLAALETPSSACLSGDGVQANLLFYRSRTRVSPPLRLERAAAGLVMTSTTDEPMEDTLVVRVRGGLASRVGAPAPRATVTLPEPSEPAAAAMRALREEMARRGLAEDEIEAFWRAWEGTLTGDARSGVAELPDAAEQPPLEEAPLRERRPSEEELPPAERIFYFLPAGTIEAMAQLEADPAPRTIVRVFGVIQAAPR